MTSSGLQVFVFTDVVGSTKLWAEHEAAMSLDLADHDQVCRDAARKHDGEEFANAGDSFGWCFAAVGSAVDAAITVQQALADVRWRTPDGISIRIGVHVGAAQRRADNLFGPVLNETARIMSTGHGGQIVVSEPVKSLLGHQVAIRDLGEHRLRDLDGQWPLFQVDVPGADNEHPPIRGHLSAASTLPTRRTALLGREDLVSELVHSLNSHRLVTLLGPGGAGKTSAAVEAAGRLVTDSDDGVFFVDLTRATEDREVPSVFVDGLGGAIDPSPTAFADHVARALAGKTALVVVDNCEHVIDGVAEMADLVLDHAPGVRLLATSREALDVEGEHVHVIPPMESGSIASPAVRLFIERALATDSAFDPNPDELGTISTIVERLDGMPLAIELAAARIRSMSPAQLLDNLDDRFRLLIGGRRRRDSRQQSLEAAIDWSYRLLDDREKTTLRRLSIANGALSLTSTARFLGVDVLEAADRIESLVSKSLLVPVKMADVSGHRLLETIRQYGRERLVEADEVETAFEDLERALDSSGTTTSDIRAFVNMAAWSSQATMEAESRLDAAGHALAAGRLRSAAALFTSATAPTQAGSIERARPQIQALVDAAGGGPAARFAQLALVFSQVWTGRMGAAARTCHAVISQTPPDDPWRPLFEPWLVYGTCCSMPVEEGLAFTAGAITRAEVGAVPARDFPMSSLLSARAILLMRKGDLAAARELFEQGLGWGDSRSPAYTMNLAGLLYVSRRLGTSLTPDRLALVEATSATDLHLQALVAIWQSVSADLPVRDRALRIKAVAGRHRLGRLVNEHGMYLTALAELAVEVGEPERARRLLAGVVPPEPLSGLVQGELTAQIGGMSSAERESWSVRTKAGMALPKEVLAERAAAAPGLLREELERWEGHPGS